MSPTPSSLLHGIFSHEQYSTDRITQRHIPPGIDSPLFIYVYYLHMWGRGRYICRCTAMHNCMCTWRPEEGGHGVSSSIVSCLFSLNPVFSFSQQDWKPPRHQWPSVSSPQPWNWSLQPCTEMPSLFLGCWNLNSSPHDYAASAQPPSQPCSR